MNVWTDQIALVTGASGSIGGAVADHLAALGARVAACDLRPSGSMHRFAQVNVTQSDQVDAWVAGICSDWGPPTIGVICAGKVAAGRLIDQPDAEWRDLMAVNLDGAFFSARAIIRAMLAAKAGGRIVIVGSWAAHAPHPHIGNYSVTKAGLRMLGRTLALDHAGDGILVNEVAPGIVDAGLSRALFDADPSLAARTRKAIPAHRLIRPEEVARDVAFLVSPENLSTTGAILVSDGGLSLASTMNPGGLKAEQARQGASQEKP